MDNLVKKLIYQSHYRSMKEADLLLSSFARANLALLDDTQLNTYEKLLENSDNTIQSWITNPESAPEDLQPMVKMIAEFVIKPS